MERQQLIDALLIPSAYRPPVEAVELRQTHISTVLLAGDFAYKIKKPVDLGFVDYSSLDRRHLYCEEEVRLNARLAPEVYLGVVPITRQNKGIQVEGEGQVVEWAVKMQRLPEFATLRAYLDRDAVGSIAFEQLAIRLTKFHASADITRKGKAEAEFAAIARNARENLDDSKTLVGITLSESTFNRLRILTESHLARLRETIHVRARKGMRCDLHGDLRLEHVYWFPDRPPPHDWIIVDCIEFDRRFRHGDPVGDIAFLSMELTLRGRADLARSFLDAYFRASGDEQGRSLVSFYTAYRAAVRGKVEGMKLAETEIPDQERAAARARARALWLFALAELEDAGRKPAIVLIAGLPGSGKSTLARDLTAQFDFTVIRSDAVRKALAGEDRSTSGSGNLYTNEWNERTYAECFRQAEQMLFDGRRALIDASFHRASSRERFLAAAQNWGVKSCMLICECEPAVTRARLASRRDDVSGADESIYADMAEQWDEPDPSTREVIHKINSTGSRGETVAQAVSVLRNAEIVGPGELPHS